MRPHLLPITFALALVFPAAADAELTDEQRSNVVEHFGKLKDLQDFSATAINAALQDDEFEAFFDGYGKLITVVQVGDKLANASDMEAFQIIGGEAAKSALEYMAQKVPALAGAATAVNFVGWANTGLTLFKDFVFDPWLEAKQMNAYIKQRNNGQAPEDAVVTTRGWGNLREAALKQLAKQGYNMELLWENGQKGKLSPAWEAKLMHFVTASLEAKHQKKLVADATKRARKDLPGLDKKAKKALVKHKHATGSDADGKLALEIRQLKAAKLELVVNGKRVKQGDGFPLAKDNKLTIRAIVVGPRRQQARDLADPKKPKPGTVKLDGTPTDYAFAYHAGANTSSWTTKDETYTWQIASKFNKVVAQSKSTSRPSIKEDTVLITLSPDIANETITLDVSGRVTWQLTGKRANGSAANGSEDETDTGAIVIHVTPRK